ncbi:NAD(P)-dependent oxidoreductase [Fibrobacterales bacterium]|nr:NAD(P)-dependent oxidoreductase [Fibrobacterales bacterium]
MKILVLGAGGMAGHTIAIYLKENGYDITGFARRELPFCKTIVGDITTVNIANLVKDYDVVINCIGCLVKSVDNDIKNGIYINSYLPHLLSASAKRVIHLSTDCVFSGKDTPKKGYTENDFRSADYAYGRTKALGELNNNKDLTFRMSIVGPDINENGTGLFHWFMKQQGEVSGYSKAIWGGVTTIILANAIHAALEQRITGLYHLTNGEKISKFELLKLFNNLRKEPVSILPSENVIEDKSICCTRTDFNFVVPSYESMVGGMGEWIQTHGSLYFRYKIGGFI